MTKTTEEYFRDWENYVFGFGYGTGEAHTVPAVKTFFDNCNADRYDYRDLEPALTPTVAWLLINTFCYHDLLEYGTSPRFGWLTETGERLKGFVGGHTAEELLGIVNEPLDYIYCDPQSCNCGDHGYEEGRVCENPFWLSAKSRR